MASIEEKESEMEKGVKGGNERKMEIGYDIKNKVNR